MLYFFTELYDPPRSKKVYFHSSLKAGFKVECGSTVEYVVDIAEHSLLILLTQPQIISIDISPQCYKPVQSWALSTLYEHLEDLQTIRCVITMYSW